jgi:DNA-binding protein H-NS
MPTLSELIAERQALDQKIALMQSQERAGAIAQVQQLMSEYGLTAVDLAGKQAPKKSTGSKVEPKYRNQATGESWSGRGLKPRWLSAALAAGKSLSDFAV